MGGLTGEDSGDSGPEIVGQRPEEIRVAEQSPSKPTDATKVTEEQRQQQERLDHRGDDPDAPALHHSRHQIPDETTR